jgi:hypothetical protein
MEIVGVESDIGGETVVSDGVAVVDRCSGIGANRSP